MAKQIYGALDILNMLRSEADFVLYAEKFYKHLIKYGEVLDEYHKTVPRNKRARHVSQLEKEIKEHLESSQVIHKH